jgi:ribonuclease D
MMSSLTSDTFEIRDGDLTAADLRHYLQSETLAVDTETMGLIPHRDRLCLVQLCDPGGQVTTLRIQRGQRSAPHLKELLESPSQEKIFHFARFDLGMLRYHLDIWVAPVFCTKLASKLARTYSPKHGLKDVVQELQRVELDKSAQSSDWGNAEHLSPEQLRYAANDVRYLIPLRHQLKAMLEREERWPLAQSCFEFLPTVVTLDLLHYGNIFEH